MVVVYVTVVVRAAKVAVDDVSQHDELSQRRRTSVKEVGVLLQ